MKIQSLISTWCLLCACITANAQTSNVTISPRYPQRGETVTVTYHANGENAAIPANASHIELVFTYTNLYEVATKIPLQKNGSDWVTSFTLPRYSVFATFYLQSGEAIDKPATDKQYEVAVYDSKGQRVRNGYLYNAYSLSAQMGRSPLLRDKQKALYEEELKHFPDNYEAKLRLLSNEISGTTDEKEKLALLQKANAVIAEKFYSNPGKMGNVNYVTMGYLIMGENSRLDSLRDVIRRRYPRTSAGIELRTDLIAKENDKQKQFAMLQAMLKEKTADNADAFGAIHSMLFKHYAENGNAQQALLQVRQMLQNERKEKSPYLPETYKEIAQTLSDNNTALDSAAAYAKLALANASNYPVGLIRYFPETGYIPSYLSDSVRTAGVNKAKSNILSLLAIISLQQKNEVAGKAYMEQALALSNDKETQLNAIRFYDQTKAPAKVADAAWNILLQVPDDTSALRTFQKNYLTDHSDKDLSAKMVELDNTWTLRMQSQLNKERINKKVPPLDSIVDMDGKPLAVSSLSNKIVILNFWATWCVPCMQEMPYMQKVYSKYKDRSDVVFLVTNSGARNTITDAQQWNGRKKYNFPVYFNGDTNLSDKLGFQVIPATYIIDQNGVIQFKLIGFEGASIEKKIGAAIDLLSR